jgi:hypothetical protein
MKRLLFIATLSLGLPLFMHGCAAPAPASVDPSRSPEQVLQSLNTRKLSTMSESDASFGLAGIKELMRPAIERCRLDGGDIAVLGRTEVRFAAKVSSSGLQPAQRVLPTRLACRNSANFLWGASVSYAEPTYFPSQWTGEVYYYANLRFGFVSGDSLERTEPGSAGNREIERRVSSECAARRQAYSQRVRASPQIGMEVAFGTIVELKPPLALVQYNSFGRQMKGRDQDWLRIDSLSAGSDCPN